MWTWQSRAIGGVFRCGGKMRKRRVEVVIWREVTEEKEVCLASVISGGDTHLNFPFFGLLLEEQDLPSSFIPL